MTRWRFVALACLLAACSPTYSKYGVTQAEWDRDAYECQREALGSPRAQQSAYRGPSNVPIYADPTLGWMDAAIASKLLDACMRARGYVRE